MLKDCYAKYDKSTGVIRLGNGKIEKVLQVKGVFVRTESVRDTANGFSWEGDKFLWQRCPMLGINENPKVTFTTEDRFGYMYQQQFGTLFVENRYTDYVNYFPHNTFKNTWNLAQVIPTRRLQMELLNPRRNTDKYERLLFAPNTYSPDYLF